MEIEGEFDDRAMTIVIGLAALKWRMKNGRFSEFVFLGWGDTAVSTQFR